MHLFLHDIIYLGVCFKFIMSINELSNDKLCRLHQVEIDILNYIVELCENNNLNYCLVYGTALGAYRHKGFIPWDDDIDIAMPYLDYEKFKQIALNDFNSEYEFQDMYNEKNYYMLFGKVRKKHTIFKEKISEQTMKKCGIYVDIFPLYKVSNYWLNAKVIRYLKHIIKFTTHRKLYRKKYSTMRFIVHTILSIPVLIFGPKPTLFFLNNYIKHIYDETGKYVAEFDENGPIQIIDANIYFPTHKLIFEGKYYNFPGKIEDYLMVAYGSDYMKLPPPEHRHTHAPIVLDFGD